MNGLDVSLASVPGSNGATPMPSLAPVSRAALLRGGRHRRTCPWEASQGCCQLSGTRAAATSAPTGRLGRAFNPAVEPYPPALGRVVLCAVGDLGLAVVQDAPDDRNAGHLLPATDQVLGLLKGHYAAGCRGPG